MASTAAGRQQVRAQDPPLAGANPRFPSKFYARNHRRQRPDPPFHARGRPAPGRPHALRRPVVRPGVRPDRRVRRDVPSPARSWAHDPAASGQLPRESLGAEGPRGHGGRGGRVGRRHPRSPAGRSRAAAPAHRLHVGPRSHVLRWRRPQGRARRLHAPVHAGAARQLPRSGESCRRCGDRRRHLRRGARVRGWKRPARSTAWTATARRWSA